MSHQVIQPPSLEETAAKIRAQVQQGEQTSTPEPEPQEQSVEAPETEEVEAEEAAEQPEAQAEEDQKSTEAKGKAEAMDEALSARFSKIAEREREFRQVEQRLSQQEERINARLAELEAREQKLSNPDHLLDVLEGLNMTPDEFQKKMLLGQIQLDKPEVDPVQQQLQALEEKTKRFEELEQRLERQQEEARLQEIETRFVADIRNAATRYENLSEYFDGDIDEIVRVADHQAALYVQEHDEVPEVEDVLSQLDAYYGSHLDRFRKKWKPQASAQEPAPKKKPSRTLKGSDTQTASTTTAGGWTAHDVSTGKISMDQWQEYVLQKLNQKG